MQQAKAGTGGAVRSDRRHGRQRPGTAQRGRRAGRVSTVVTVLAAASLSVGGALAAPAAAAPRSAAPRSAAPRSAAPTSGGASTGKAAEIGGAPAAVSAPFLPRFSANVTGDILLRGNTLLTCPSSAPTCAAARSFVGPPAALDNNDYQMRYVDQDADPTTFASSSAEVTLPAGSKVLFAGLYWSAYTGTTGGRTLPDPASAEDRLLFKVPGARSYTPLTASVTNTQGIAYDSFADVTSLVSAAGSGSYAAANIYASLGKDTYGGWVLAIAIADPADPVRNLTVIDGFAGLHATPVPEHLVDIPVSGFATPPTGPVRTRIGVVAFEGDQGLVGDSMSVVGQSGSVVPITDAVSPVDNVFNSRITDGAVEVPGRVPDGNTFGVDAKVFDSGAVLGNGATSATLRAATSQDTYFPAVFTLAVDLYAPKLVSTKTATVSDVDGDGRTDVGDRITYTVDTVNSGVDAAHQAVMSDRIPAGTRYVPGSLVVDGTARTDGVDGDGADVTTGVVHAQLGQPGSGGGTLAPGADSRVSFTVQITPALAGGGTLDNVATTAYTSSRGTPFTGTSNQVLTPVATRSVDLYVTGSATPTVVPLAGDRVVVWTLRYGNRGPDVEPDATMDVTLPPGVSTVTSFGAPFTVSGSSGSQLRFTLGRLTVGSTGTLIITSTLPLDALDPSITTARIAGVGLERDPGDNSTVVSVAVSAGGGSGAGGSAPGRHGSGGSGSGGSGSGGSGSGGSTSSGREPPGSTAGGGAGGSAAGGGASLPSLASASPPQSLAYTGFSAGWLVMLAVAVAVIGAGLVGLALLPAGPQILRRRPAWWPVRGTGTPRA